MTLSVMLSNYALAGLELLRSLPVAAIVDPASPGSSFAIHPGTGLVRVNGRFVQLPFFPSKTTCGPPTAVLEHPNPSSRAVPTPTTTTTFDPVGLTSQSGTGILVALNMLFILWLLSLVVLSLTHKPVFLVASVWLTNLRRRVLETTCIITQSIVRVVLSANSKLNTLVDTTLCSICSIQVTLGIAVYSLLKSAVNLVLKSSRVLLPIGALAAVTDVLHTISVVYDITIPYGDILLVIAATPAAVASCIFLAVLAGVIKPISSTLPPAVEHEADFLAGMRVQRKRFISEIISGDHSSEVMLDIRGTYHQILRTRDQVRAARSCGRQMKNLVAVWVTTTLFAVGLGYLPFSSVPARIDELSRLTLSSRPVEGFESETFYPTIINNSINSTNASVTLTWTPCILPVTAGAIGSPFAYNSNSRFKPYSRFTLSLVEHSARSDAS